MTHAQQALHLTREQGLIRSRDLSAHGLPRMTLTRLTRSGQLERVAPGVYALPDRDVSEHHGLAEVAKRVPHGVVCLLSALRYHGLTTQEPFEVWLAIDRKARKPTLTHPPLRIVRFSGAALNSGVESRELEGVTVRLTSPARTVADCFRYRAKVGLDVALEALREYLEQHKGTLDELWAAADVAHVRTILRPYLEALA
jgi:predicted transcriptional regulator of viral defense system